MSLPIIDSLKRKWNRFEVTRKINNANYQNEGVVNIHRIDTKNIGDYYCAPHHYFEPLKGKYLDIFDYKREEKSIRNNYIDKVCSKSIIVGGGGLLNRGGFEMQMKLFESLSQKGKKIVLWGVGHNEKSPKTYGKVTNYNVDVTKFGLAGTRDFSMPGEYVPCVSCMHDIFDGHFETRNEVGVVFHKDTLKKDKITSLYKDIPSSSNTTDLDELINFIGSCEHIITDSYHTMYWAMLLNKKVVVVPNSSKFYDFKQKPVISTFDNALNDIKKASIFTGLKEECREINVNFSKKVFDYLNL